MSNGRTRLAAATTVASLVGYLGMVSVDRQTGGLRDHVAATTIGWYLLAFAVFGVAIWANERSPFDRRLLWLAPVVFRLLLLSTEPTLSDDVYRYLWDGHLVNEGVNPYAYPIAAPELDAFEIPARRLANNPSLSSPYLPAAHGLFGAINFASGQHTSPFPTQLAMVAFDLATAAVIGKLLVLAKLPRRRVLLYLWNPLIIVEVAHGAHLDAFMTFATVVALWAAMDSAATTDMHGWRSSARLWISPFALAIATLTRPIPLLLLPVLWWRWSWAQRLLYAAATVVPLAALSGGPSGWGLSEESNGAGVFGSARTYSQDFRFNAGLYNWLEGIFGTSATPVTVIVGLTVAAVLVGVWLSARKQPYGQGVLGNRRLLRLSVIPVSAYVLLTPVLHPWYLILLLTLLVFVAPARSEISDRWVWLAPWYYLAAAVSLSYLTYNDPTAFSERNWVRVVEWFPTLVGLIACGFWGFFAVHAETPRGSGSTSCQPKPSETPTVNGTR